MYESDTHEQHCPVCHMIVDNGCHAVEYQGQSYAFCSLQCRQRFESNPHLYIGHPGHLAPKQHGCEVVKHRVLKLSDPLSDSQAEALLGALRDMMGIKEVFVEGDRIDISYDLLQATAEQIESTIETTGNGLEHGLGARLKLAFIHYLEETELDNLEQPGHGHRH